MPSSLFTGSDMLGCISYLLHVYWFLAAGAAIYAFVPQQNPSRLKLEPLLRLLQAILLSSSRGKTWDEAPKSSLGSLSDWTVPQGWFAHFYDVGVLTCLVSLAFAWSVIGQATHPDTCTWVALGLLLTHLVRRSLETHFLMRYPTHARMHLIAYAFGLSYYIALPLSCLPDASWAGTQWAWPEPRALAHTLHAAFRRQPPASLLGCTVCAAGQAVQFQSHYLLAQLRPPHRAGEGTLGFYQIPRGGLFEYVSCPHYLGEIIIYAGLLLVLGAQSALPWLIFTWVVANLLLAATPTHRWYRQHFKEYPGRRRAIFPFIY